MPLSIPNTTLLDAYDATTTFAGTDVFAWGFFTVANNAAFVQLFEGASGQAVPQPEVFCPPATYPIAAGQGGRPVSGIRARNAVAGSPVQFFGSVFYPQEPGIQAGTPFTAVVSAAGAVGVGVGVLDRNTAIVTVAATAAENSIYTFTVPGGTMAVDSMLRLTLMGDYLFNNNIANTLTLRVKFGGVTFYADAGGSGVLGAVREPWNAELWLPNLGALNSQWLAGNVNDAAPDVAAPTSGEGAFSLRTWQNNPGGGIIGVGAPQVVDTSVNQVLDVTVQWSAASANNSFIKRYALLEIL